jgi:DNA-binding transcriptional LysR family regulator
MPRINFDFQQLDAFIAVAERGSFRAAAEQIHLSPPALSRRIGQLEASLGVRLFNRTTRAVELTGPGRAFLQRAQTVLDGLEHAALGVGDIALRQAGKVTLACVPSAAYYFLPPVLRTFSDQYPGIQLRIIDESESVVLQSVISAEADFGIGFMRARVPEIDFEPLLTDAFVLAVHRSHRFASRKTVLWTDLEGERLMTAARSSGNRQLIDDALAKANLRPAISVEVSRVSTLVGMVEAGLGVAVMPRLALPAAAHPTLVGIPLREPSITRRLGILRRHGAALHPVADIFNGVLRSAFLAKKRGVGL